MRADQDAFARSIAWLVFLALASCGGGGSGGNQDITVPSADSIGVDTRPTGEGITITPFEALDPEDWADNGDGTVTDLRTGLMWDKASSIGYQDWQSAGNTCKDMALAGYTDWRLPKIDELRYLVVGCTPTMSGGRCEVASGCAGSCWTEICRGCTDWSGPGDEGCYLNPVLKGNCTVYWSSSSMVDDPIYAWTVAYYDGRISGHNKIEVNARRCVR